MYIKIIKEEMLVAKQLKVLFGTIAFDCETILFIITIVAINIVGNSATQELFNKNEE